MGCLTTYGIGSAPPYYGTGYVPQAKWYQFGFIFSVIYLVVWVGVGSECWGGRARCESWTWYWKVMLRRGKCKKVSQAPLT